MKPHAYLMDEYPHFFYPTLAERIGLNEAIVLQQIHSWVTIYQKDPRRYAEKHYHDGHWWIWNSYPEWHEKLPYFSEHTVRRALDHLRELNLVLVDQFNAMPMDRTNWYAIDYEAYDELLSKMDGPSDQNGQMHLAKMGGAIPDSSLPDSSTDPSREEKSARSAPCPSGSSESLITFRDPDENQLIEDPTLPGEGMLITRTRGKAPTPNSAAPPPHAFVIPGARWIATGPGTPVDAELEFHGRVEWTAADVQVFEMIDGDEGAYCKHCNSWITFSHLHSSSALCPDPDCRCPVQVADEHGQIIKRPPQKYREGYRAPKESPPTSLGKLVDDCPPALAEVYVPLDKQATFLLLYKQSPGRMIAALEWAIGAGHQRRSAASAIGAIQRGKFADAPAVPRGTEQPVEERPMMEVSEEFAAILRKEFANNEEADG